MTRSSFQKGYVFSRMAARGKIHVIRYRVRTADGEWRHKAETVNSPKRKDAERLLAERLREVNRGVRLPSEITFSAFAEDHWKAYVNQNLKPSTKASHNANLNKHLLPAFGSLRLREISALQVANFLNEKATLLKPKSRLNLYLLLQKMLKLAVDLELLPASPMQRVPRPKVERTEKPTLTPAQVRDIVNNLPENYRALVILLYLTGVRIGEALALKWSDLDFESSKLYIRRSVWRGSEQTPKSRRSIRAKHLLAGLEQSLRHHLSLTLYKKPGDYVFANGTGRSLSPDDLRRRFLYPAMDKAGIERKMARAYGFHLFRHSAGTQMHEATGDLKQTQSFLGHSGISITSDVYVHLQPDSEIEPLQKLEKAFFSEPCSVLCSEQGKRNQEGSKYSN